MLSPVTCRALNIFPLFHKGHDFRKKKKKELLVTKCVLIFSTALSETFLILGRTEWDMIENIYWSSCTRIVPVIIDRY